MSGQTVDQGSWHSLAAFGRPGLHPEGPRPSSRGAALAELRRRRAERLERPRRWTHEEDTTPVQAMALVLEGRRHELRDRPRDRRGAERRDHRVRARETLHGIPE